MASVSPGVADVAVVGSPVQIADQLNEKVFDVGIDSFTVNLKGHGHTPGLIAEVGEAIKAVLPNRVIPEWSRS